MDPRRDAAAPQRAMHAPLVSSSTAPPRVPEYLVPGAVKPVLNYSIQTEEEFALEFMRDRAMSQKILATGTSRDQNAATSGYMDLRGMLGASHTASETGPDIFMLQPIVDPRHKEPERKPVAQVQNRSRHSSTRSVSRALSGGDSTPPSSATARMVVRCQQGMATDGDPYACVVCIPCMLVAD